jgi:hypothetical protein
MRKISKIMFFLAIVILVSASFAGAEIRKVDYDPESNVTSVIYNFERCENPWVVYGKLIPGEITLQKVKDRIMDPNGITDPRRIPVGREIVVSGSDLNYLLPEDYVIAYSALKSANEEILRLDDEIDELRAEKEDFRVENEKLRAENERLEAENARLQSQLAPERESEVIEGFRKETIEKTDIGTFLLVFIAVVIFVAFAWYFQERRGKKKVVVEKNKFGNSISSLIIAVIFSAVLMSGCATGGFSLEQRDPQGIEQPYRAVAAEGIKFEEIKSLYAILFPLDTSDCQWVGELGVIDKEKREVYRREVWRGWAEIDGKINERPHPAVINKTATHLFFLIPNVKREDIVGVKAIVLSGASTRALTPDGNIHNLPKGKKADRDLVQEFFMTNPVRTSDWQVVDFSPGTQAGDAFIGEMRKRFPILLTIGGGDLMATTDVVDASEMTTRETMVDKIISEGRMPLSAMTVLALSNPIAATIISTRIFIGLSVVANDKEMAGPYGETNFPGWAVGKVLGYYLKENHRYANYLEKILQAQGAPRR